MGGDKYGIKNKGDDRSDNACPSDHGDLLSMGNRKVVANRIQRRIKATLEDLSNVLSIPVKLSLYGFHIGAGLLFAICTGMQTLGAYTPLIIVVWFSPELALVAREVIRQMRSLPQSEAFETSAERWNKVLAELVESQEKH